MLRSQARRGVEVPVLLIGCALWGGCATSAVESLDDSGNAIAPEPLPDAAAFADAYAPGPKSPERDAGVVPREAGAGDHDAALPEPDANLPMAEPDASVAPVDAGSGPGPRIAPTVDGKIGENEWSYASVATQSQASAWGVGKNELSALHAVVEGEVLYMAVSGLVEAQNALVVYVDARSGVGAPPSALTDNTGSLDNALSAAISVPAGVDVDFAWGTRSMARSASGFDDATGWRDLTLASNFAWLDATSLASVVCGVSACETRIPLATLAATRAEVKVFARIVTATGADVANQTLPFDAPETPASVRSLLSLVVPE